MKPILSAIALSCGLIVSPAIAQKAEVAPRSVQVESDDSIGVLDQGEKAKMRALSRKAREMAKPLEELPEEIDRRYKKK